MNTSKKNNDYNKYNCNGILLEPRLQEYIKKKKYYKSNNIQPGVPLEKEFDITQEDINLIKNLKSGNKNIYDNDAQEKLYIKSNDNFDIKTGFLDPDEMYKADPRYKNYLVKKQREQQAIDERYAYGVPKNSREDLREKKPSSKLTNIPRDLRLYNRQPNDPFDLKKEKVSQSVHELQTYSSKLNKMNNLKRDIRDVGLEATIQCGTSTRLNPNAQIDPNTITRGKKSLGYENPFEHYFGYIDDDVQDPDHLVMDRGYASRLDNHNAGRYDKPMKRDVY
jgi:hypothetical protein